MTAKGPKVRWRPWWLLGIGLLVAMTICGGQAVLILRFRSPTPAETIPLGEPVTVGGVRYRLDTFESAPTFPAKEQGDPEITALAGAVLVKIIFTEEVVDPGRDLGSVFCDLTLNAPDGRRWTGAYDIAYKVQLPTAVTCSGSTDDPVRLGVPFEVGAVFMVPADAAEQLTFRMRLSTEQTLVEFRR